MSHIPFLLATESHCVVVFMPKLTSLWSSFCLPSMARLSFGPPLRPLHPTVRMITQLKLRTRANTNRIRSVVSQDVTNILAATALAVETPTTLACGIWVLAVVVMTALHLARVWKTKTECRQAFAKIYYGVSSNVVDLHTLTPFSTSERGVLRKALGPARSPAEQIEVRVRVANFFWDHTYFRKHRYFSSL